jgi:hypothetical protein
MSPSDGEPGASARIEREIGSLRTEIAELVGELDRRRREAFDVRLQLRRHPVAVAVAGVALAALLGGTVALLVHDGRRKQRPGYKAKQMRVAMGRVMRHPERVARGEAPPGEKILAAVGTALATLLVRRAFERAVPSPRARRPRHEQASPSEPAHA